MRHRLFSSWVTKHETTSAIYDQLTHFVIASISQYQPVWSVHLMSGHNCNDDKCKINLLSKIGKSRCLIGIWFDLRLNRSVVAPHILFRPRTIRYYCCHTICQFAKKKNVFFFPRFLATHSIEILTAKSLYMLDKSSALFCNVYFCRKCNIYTSFVDRTKSTFARDQVLWQCFK